MSARPMKPRPSAALRADVVRRSTSASPIGRAMPNFRPDPVGSVVVATIQSGSTVVPGALPALSADVRSASSCCFAAGVLVYSSPPSPTANGTSPRSRDVFANTVASSFGMSTSAFTCPTSCPSRSTLTARRLPDICVDRFVTGAGTLAAGGGATGPGATGAAGTRAVRGVRAGAGAGFGAGVGDAGGVAATAGAVEAGAVAPLAAAAAVSWVRTSTARDASSFCSTLMPCATPAMRCSICANTFCFSSSGSASNASRSATSSLNSSRRTRRRSMRMRLASSAIVDLPGRRLARSARLRRRPGTSAALEAIPRTVRRASRRRRDGPSRRRCVRARRRSG